MAFVLKENVAWSKSAIRKFVLEALVYNVVKVRLAKLESLLSKDGYANTDNKEESSMIKDLESRLHSVQDELVSQKEKASTKIKKLEAENKKLQYRVTHLIQALKEADLKLKNIKT